MGNFLDRVKNKIKRERKKKEKEKERIKEQEERRKARQLKRESYIQSVMQETGWDRDETIAKIEDAKARIGITYKDYAQWRMFTVPIDDQQRKYRRILRRRDLKKRNKEKAIINIMEATGMSREETLETIKETREKNGARYDDYLLYRFWEISEEEQATYFNESHASQLREKYNPDRDAKNMLSDKSIFIEDYKQFLGRPACKNKDLTLEKFKELFGNEEKVIYKPLELSGGVGVRCFPLNEDNVEEVYQSIVDLYLGIVEGYIDQHHELNKYSTKSVNTVRIVTIKTEDKAEVVYAVLRMAAGDTIVDNFHSGGLIANIDIDTGIIVTDGTDAEGHTYREHPATKAVFKGFQIPYWNEVKELVLEAAMVPEKVNYVGWDVAITEKGPVIVEGNTHPAWQLLQLPFVAERKGMKHVIEKYL